MNFLELVKLRQSNRAYENRPVEREKIERCLEAARLSPSANNAQSWTFVVIDDVELKNRVTEAAFSIGGAFMKQAPVIILLIAEKPLMITRLGNAVKKMDMVSLDMGIAAAHLCLQAAESGLGTCMIESFNEQKVKSLLDIPDGRRIALLVSLGYPADKQREKKRKTFDQVVRWNKY